MSDDDTPSRSELYAKNQGLFDQRFTEIIVKTFVGFERTMFDQLSGNDDEPAPMLSVHYHGEAAENLRQAIEDGMYYLPEGTSLTWDDGTPIPNETEEW